MLNKKWVLRCFRKTAEFGSLRMLSGRELHADGPACEKARSPNLDRSCGSVKSMDDVDLRRWRSCGRLPLADCTMFFRYTGQFPWETECIRQHSLYWMRQRTGSQCNWSRLGVTCSLAPSSKTRRAAAFCTRHIYFLPHDETLPLWNLC